MDGVDYLITLIANYGLAIALAVYLVRYIVSDLKNDITTVMSKLEEVIAQNQELIRDVKLLVEKNTTLIELMTIYMRSREGDRHG